jgi:NitT/TauT family transport system substrate-binding protein
VRRVLAVACVALLMVLAPSLRAVAEDLPVVRVAVLKYGTANWELELISQLGIDRAHGFRLELLQRVSPNASLVALQGGAADITVSDWLWVAQQQAAGRDFRFYPYSTAVGELLVAPDSDRQALADLAGAELGIAGGSEDKSWRLFQAYARREGLELAELARPRYAAPPLLNGLAGTGQLDAVLTYWHYAARLKAQGWRPLLSLDEVLARLGVQTEVPMLGWVFSGGFGDERADLVDGFLRASYEAKRRLLNDDEAWSRIEPLMRAESDAVFRELRAGYRAGVPRDFDDAHRLAIRRVASLVAAARDEGATSEARAIPSTVFWQLQAAPGT